MATILNVDDNEGSRYSKARILRSAGFTVLEAGTGDGALRMATEQLPDLLLLDVHLPDMSGLDVCQRLRDNPRTQRMPIIHISATAVSPQDELKSLDAGADLYLAEPIGPAELLTAIKTMLRLRATEQGLAASEERMRLAADAAGIGAWEVDLITRRSIWSERFRQLLGESGSAEPSLQTWLDRVHAEDRMGVHEAFDAALNSDAPLRVEHRVVLADGEERWLALFGQQHAGKRMIGVAMDITERKRAEQERERLLDAARSAQLAAEQAARMKDDFLATLSHELRTPMSAMLGWLHILKTGQLSSAQQAAAIDTIERNAYLQNQLVNDMLDVSRIMAGKMDLDMHGLALDDAVTAAIDTARTAATARGVELVLSIEPGSWIVNGNAERLQQVFNNLLSNAIKFSPRGARVELRLQRSEGGVSVSVTDQGEGIPADMLPHIFEKFRQADSSTRRRHGGLGLGLSIVRSLVEMHGGTVVGESAGTGKGAKFTVTLPLYSEERQAISAAVGGSAAAAMAGMRVLVVDDDMSNLEMVAKMLQLNGALVMTSSDAFSALALARNWTPDAMILDIGMPDKDGYELLEELRELFGDSRKIPAVALTGFTSSEDRARALRAGFHAHISKPFDMQALCVMVAQLVERTRPAG
jgi:PAS domain S-box-containing protein